MKKSLSISSIAKREQSGPKNIKKGICLSKHHQRNDSFDRQRTILDKYFTGFGQLEHIPQNYTDKKSKQTIYYPHKHDYLQYHRIQMIPRHQNLSTVQYLQIVLEVEIIDNNKQQPLFSEIGCCQDSSIKSIKCQCLINDKNELFINDIYSTKRIAYINFDTLSCVLITNQYRKFNDTSSKGSFNQNLVSKKQHKLEFNENVSITFDNPQNQKLYYDFFDQVKKSIKRSYGYQNKLMEIISIPRFYQKKYILEKQFFHTCQTGDIILFQSKSIMSKFQRYFTNSQFDHVAMIIRDDLYNVLIYQSNGLSGVCMTPWQFITSVHCSAAFNRIVWRKLQGVERNSKFKKTLKSFILNNLQTKYNFSFRKLLTSDKSYEKSQKSQQNGFFCSQLIALVYKQLNLLSSNDLDANFKLACQYLPYDFTDKANLKLKNGAKLSQSHEIVMLAEKSYQQSILIENIFK